MSIAGSSVMRLRLFTWLAIFLTLIVGVVGLNIENVALHIRKQTLLFLLVFAVYAAFFYGIVLICRARWPDGKALTAAYACAVFFEALTQIECLFVAGFILQHLCGMSPRPYVDQYLLYADKLLQFDWLACMHWFNLHPRMAEIAWELYNANAVQCLLLPLLLSLGRQHSRLYCAVLALLLSLIICIVTAAFIPATSIVTHLHVDTAMFSNVQFWPGYLHVATLEQLRHHTLSAIDILPHDPKGLVTFPSYHASMAVIFIWAFWEVRWARWPMWCINLLMLVATPCIGGHYLIDVIGGIPVAILSIYLVRRYEERCCIAATYSVAKPQRQD